MQPPYQPAVPPQDGQPTPPARKKRHGRFMRFLRGYLMVAGALATLAGLTLLIVRLFVEIQEFL